MATTAGGVINADISGSTILATDSDTPQTAADFAAKVNNAATQIGLNSVLEAAKNAQAIATAALVKSNNLSDLTNVAAAQINLGLKALAFLAVGVGFVAASGSLSVAYGKTVNTALQGSLLAAASGVAPLDASALVPLVNLPSAIDQAGLQAQSAVLAGPTGAAGAVAWRKLAYGDITGLGTIAQQSATNVAITGGAINGTAIGVTTASTGSFTTLSTSGAVTLNGNLTSALSIKTTGTLGIDLSGGTFSGEAIRLAGNGSGQSIGWLYSGSTASISVSWPNFVFSNGINAPSGTISGLWNATSLTASSLSITGNAGATTFSGDGSALNVLVSGSTTARSLANRAGDTINIKDYGAKLTGINNDIAALQAVYNATPNNGTVFIPGGGWDVVGTVTTTAGKNVLWQATGPLNFATGTTPVTTIGDGDTYVAYYLGRLNYSKTITAATNGHANVQFSLVNKSNAGQFSGVVGNLYATATSAAGASGYTWNITSQLTSGATNGGNNQDVGIASVVVREGACATWQYFGQTKDITGLPPNSGSSIVAFEFDINATGPENSASAYSYGSGSRVYLHLASNALQPTAWTAATVEALAAVIQPSVANGFTYICTTAGTTGATEPSWPASNTSYSISSISWVAGVVTVVTSAPYQSGLTAGNTFLFSISGCTPNAYNVSSIVAAVFYGTVVDSQTFTFPLATNPGTETALGSVSVGIVLDGTVVWSYGTTVNQQISRAIDIGGDSFSSYGCAIAGTASYYNAILDFSFSTLVSYAGSSPAAIRLAPDMPIDFSGNKTLAGQNNRILQYTSATDKFQYIINGVSAFDIKDNSAVVLNSSSDNGVSVHFNDNNTSTYTPIFIAGSNVASVVLDFTSYTSTAVTLTPNTIRFNASNSQGISWLYYGSSAAISVTWPNFVFSNGININTASGLLVQGVKVVGAQVAGWGTSTGGIRGALVASSATLLQTAEALAQLLTDLKTHGLLGA